MMTDYHASTNLTRLNFPKDLLIQETAALLCDASWVCEGNTENVQGLVEAWLMVKPPHYLQDQIPLWLCCIF